MKTDVIVIGGGLNGLTAAALLAKKGKRVRLLERSAHLGGVFSSREFAPGCFSQGIWPHVRQLNSRVVDALELESFGLKFEAPTSTAGDVLLPEATSSKKPGQFLHSYVQTELKAYHQFFDRIRPFVQSVMDRRPFTMAMDTFSDWSSALQTAVGLRRLGKEDMVELIRVAPMPLRDFVGEYAKTPRLQAALAMSGAWSGQNGPWAPMGTFGLLVWESTQGPQIQGGSAALVQALHQAALKYGVEISTRAEVAQILVDQEHSQGVRLKDGTQITAPHVISTCDPKSTLLNLVTPEHVTPHLERQITSYRARGNASVLHLALKEPITWASNPELKSQDWNYARLAGDLIEVEKSFDALKYRSRAERPVLEVWKSSTQPNVLSIFALGTAYQQDGGWTEEAKESVKKSILSVLGDYVPGIESQVMAHQLLTPQDLESEYGIWQGHLFHGELAPDQTLMMRPIPSCAGYKTPIQGLWLSGAGTHPGIGPSCTAGLLTAEAVLS